LEEINEMPPRNRLINVILKSLSSILPKRSSQDETNKNKKKCRAYTSFLPTEKLVLKKGRKIGSVDFGDLSYHLVSFEGCNGDKYCSIDVCDKTETCVNQMLFDMKTAWQITLLLLDVVNENPLEDENRWIGKAKRNTKSPKEHRDE